MSFSTEEGSERGDSRLRPNGEETAGGEQIAKEAFSPIVPQPRRVGGQHEVSLCSLVYG